MNTATLAIRLGQRRTTCPACRPKLSVGAMCAFGTPAPGYPDIGGDHACVTGKCDPTKHTCN